MTGNERDIQKIAAILIQFLIPCILSIDVNTPVRGNSMTISQIRRRINALKRRFAPELAIIKLRRIAQVVADDWTPDEPPEPTDVIRRITGAGFRLPTFVRIRRYLDDTRRRGDIPDPCEIVLNLLPWADNHRYLELLRWDLPAPAR